MPESSSLYREKDHLAQFSGDANLESDDDAIPDIGELLGFRVTGGKDFFMPITIFHVNTCNHNHVDIECHP
jgi:hypothetical protein